jgi:hypothetical protein
VSQGRVYPVFPTIDLRALLIPWEKCLGVEPDSVDPAVIAVMEQEDYDFAPVFQPAKSGLEVLLEGLEGLYYVES